MNLDGCGARFQKNAILDQKIQTMEKNGSKIQIQAVASCSFLDLSLLTGFLESMRLKEKCLEEEVQKAEDGCMIQTLER